MKKSFEQILSGYQWNEAKDSIYAKKKQDVERALGALKPDLEDFKSLISPAADAFLEQIAQKSKAITEKRFGKVMQLYIPLYLSNACANACIYCGFSHNNHIQRITLTADQVMKEVEVIKQMGFQHVLLVTGEHPVKSGINYLKDMVELIKPHFSQLSIEVQPMDEQEYEELVRLGLNAVYVYQETYCRDRYGDYHPRGKKADFGYRLQTPERIGRAGVHKIGLGCLLGLEDWRTDSFFTAMHLSYLERNFWRTRYSVSFPRLRPHMGAFQPNVIVSDRELAQLIVAYRIFNPDVDLSLSTRETQRFRDHMMQLGITAMSAGSKTEPGGYAVYNNALEQFSVADDRTPEVICKSIRSKGYEPVWKDWDACLQD